MMSIIFLVLSIAYFIVAVFVYKRTKELVFEKSLCESNLMNAEADLKRITELNNTLNDKCNSLNRELNIARTEMPDKTISLKDYLFYGVNSINEGDWSISYSPTKTMLEISLRNGDSVNSVAVNRKRMIELLRKVGMVE